MADAALIGFPNAGKSHVHLRGERGEAEDRRTTRSPRSSRTSASCGSRTTSSSSPTSPASSRARPRAAGSATSSCATSSAPGCSWCCSTSRRWTGARPRSRSGSCSTSSAATGPSCSTGRGSWSAPRPTSRSSTYDGLCISAVTHQGLDPIVGRIGELVDERPGRRARARELRRAPAGGGGLRGASATPTARSGCGGRAAERVVAMADLTNAEAIEYVHVRFRRMGVEKALARGRRARG